MVGPFSLLSIITLKYLFVVTQPIILPCISTFKFLASFWLGETP